MTLLLCVVPSSAAAQAEGAAAVVPEADPSTAPSPLVTRQAHVMGTAFRLEVEASTRPASLALSEEILAALDEVEDLLSTWRTDSPLSRANRAPVGTPHPLGPGLRSLLAEALEWSRRTDGAFDPRVGALVDAWELRGKGKLPDSLELARALAATGDAGVALTSEGLLRHHPEAWLDAGAFGKGAGLRAALGRLPTGVPVLLDLGGQLAVSGPGPAAGGRWPIEVAHPGDRHRPVARLLVLNASVATSGNSERGLVVAGTRLGHLLDPRTGLPVPDRGSVTVVAGDPMVADLLSTALYVLGPEKGLALAHTWSSVGALFMEEGPDGLILHCNDAMERLLDPAFGVHTPSCTTP